MYPYMFLQLQRVDSSWGKAVIKEFVIMLNISNGVPSKKKCTTMT